MYFEKNKNIKKLMTFEVGLYERVNSKAEKAGVNFQDYVKHLLIQDFENSLPIEYAGPGLARKIKASINDYLRGEFIEFDPFDEAQLRKALPK